jgi:hypothetical protein
LCLDRVAIPADRLDRADDDFEKATESFHQCRIVAAAAGD